MSRLQDKVAIVTGASRGIGRAIAESFAREGASVIICGRKQEPLGQVARELSGLAGRIVPIACHVGRLDDLERLVDRATRELGQIDIMVNNAGTNIAQGPALEMTDAQFDKMVEVRGSGSIINIASIAGIRPQFQSLLYSMTKAALIMLTQSYALELGPRGVRVNAIAPGLVETTLSEFYWKDESRFRPLMERQPIKHLGQPSEIAEIALMLASDNASYLTGQTIIVDGGRLLCSM